MFPSSFCEAVAVPPLLLPYDRLSYQQATGCVHLAPSEISVCAGTRIIENLSSIWAGRISRNDLIHRGRKVLKAAGASLLRLEEDRPPPSGLGYQDAPKMPRRDSMRSIPLPG